MTARPGLMPIGAFARLCRLTVKAVRHYDAEGLLAPAVVDPHSGYRYYRADQVPAATTIAVLRGLDVPLPVVREVLTAGDADGVADVLAGQRERWAAELARREEVLRALDGLLRRPERVRYDVTIGPREAVRLRGITGPVRAAALDADTSALCLAALIQNRGQGESVGRGPLVAVYPLDLAEEMAVTVGLPDPAGPTELPGGAWATTLHVGPYAQLPLAYTALLEHVREHGHAAAGPITETYLADPGTTAPAELVTRLAVALAD
jgi:DNA-binding transcriptional MerR regulator